jgi:Ras-related protein Rab-6A
VDSVSKYQLGKPTNNEIGLIGDEGVGRTSIAWKYAKGQFLDDTKPPLIGGDFHSKAIEVDGQRVNVGISTLNHSHSEYPPLNKRFDYRCFDAVVFVYDISSKSSFDSLESWIEKVRQDSGKMPLMFIVGNKSDVLEDEKQVRVEDSEVLAASLNGKHFITSAKLDDVMLDSMFEEIARLSILRRETLQDTANSKASSDTSQKSDSQCTLS